MSFEVAVAFSVRIEIMRNAETERKTEKEAKAICNTGTAEIIWIKRKNGIFFAISADKAFKIYIFMYTYIFNFPKHSPSVK